MYKVILEYARINRSMKLKFNLILKDNNPKFNMKLIDKFNFNGVDYLKFSPHPYLTLDISSPLNRGESWSSNNMVTLNQQGLFLARRHIRKAVESLKTEDLFLYVNDRLVVNQDIANTVTTKFISGNKHVLLRPVVVYDDDNPLIEYEGICLMINSVDNFCNLTIDEAEFLYYTLDKINLIDLAMNVINTSMMLKSKEVKKVKTERIIEEVKQENIEVKANFNPKKEDNTIPEI